MWSVVWLLMICWIVCICLKKLMWFFFLMIEGLDVMLLSGMIFMYFLIFLMCIVFNKNFMIVIFVFIYNYMIIGYGSDINNL